MKIKKLDLTPPRPTGNPEQDIQALDQYLAYQFEQLNYILTIIEKEINNG